MNSKRLRNWALGVCTLAVLSFTSSPPALAQERVIFINGQRLNPQDIATREAMKPSLSLSIQ